MRNHVESKHYVKVGDPLSAWIRAGERWDRQQGILPEVSPEQEPKAAPHARSSNVMEDVQPSVSTPPTSADTVKLMAAGKALEARMSELAASQSQLQASCTATLSKVEADCSVNTATIAKMAAVQEKLVETNAINSADLIGLKKEVKESLDAISNKQEEIYTQSYDKTQFK